MSPVPRLWCEHQCRTFLTFLSILLHKLLAFGIELCEILVKSPKHEYKMHPGLGHQSRGWTTCQECPGPSASPPSGSQRKGVCPPEGLPSSPHRWGHTLGRPQPSRPPEIFTCLVSYLGSRNSHTPPLPKSSETQRILTRQEPSVPNRNTFL